MASIKAELQQFTSMVGARGGDAWDAITNFFSNIKSQASAAIGSLIPGSVVGINVNRIPEMTASIEAAVAAIENHLSEVHVNTDPSQAFADPGMQQACRAYISGVMDACKAYTSQLLKLADMLIEIKNSYEAQQAAMNETLNTAASEAASSVERYTRQM